MGGFIFLVIIVIAVVVIVNNSKKKNSSSEIAQSGAAQGTSYANKVPNGADMYIVNTLRNSPYYAQYKTCFEYIIWRGDMQRYKVDWLLKSLDMGRNLEGEGSYVMQSIDNDLPYFCETEYEYSYFKRSKYSFTSDIDNMADFAFLYIESNESHSHPDKRQYWQNRLREEAESGNYIAQGKLCSHYAKFAFSESEAEEFKNRYQTDLIKVAESGDPYAQIAVGKFIAEYGSQEEIDWLTRATKNDLTDAWLELGRAYEALRHTYPETTDENGNVKRVQKRVPDDEWDRLTKKADECYYRGAVANNGIMSGLCQEHIASCYADGDSIFPKDLYKAKEWYEKALENGESVEGDISYINRQLGIS